MYDTVIQQDMQWVSYYIGVQIEYLQKFRNLSIDLKKTEKDKN
jgi:hypothetical protein